MESLPHVLHPGHGTLVMNIHGGFLPNPLQQLRLKLSGSSFAQAGFDPASSQGAEVLRLAHLYRSGPDACPCCTCWQWQCCIITEQTG